MKRERRENTLLYMLANLRGHGPVYGLCALVMCCYGLVESVVTGQLYGIILDIGSAAGSSLAQALALLVVMVAVVALCALAAIRFYAIALDADRQVRERIVKRLLRVPLGIWQGRHEADWLMLVGKDAESATQAYKSQIITLTGHIVSIVGGMVVVGAVHAGYALFAVALGLCYFWIGMLRRRAMRKYSDQHRAAFNEAAALIQNQYEGGMLLRFYQIGLVLREKFDGALLRTYDFSLRAAKLNAVNGALGQLGYMLAYTGTLLIGMLLVWRLELTAQTMLTLWPVALGVAFSIQRIGFFHTEYQATASAVGRIAEVERLPAEQATPAEDAGVQGAPLLRLEHLYFSYDGERDVIRDVSFQVAKREKICIVGESGSGKSTIARLLLRLYPLKGGEIFLDGKRAEAYTLKAYRGHFAYVPQTPRLFSVSIEDNIRMGNLKGARGDIEAAAKRARADSFVRQLPAGYESVLGEAGLALSGGEQQRIAIARAYMRKDAILVSDEMTAALDGDSEAAIMDTIWSNPENTVIFITHHIKNAGRADRIIVMRDGQIVENGTHDELMRLRGYYRELLDSEA